MTTDKVRPIRFRKPRKKTPKKFTGVKRKIYTTSAGDRRYYMVAFKDGKRDSWRRWNAKTFNKRQAYDKYTKDGTLKEFAVRVAKVNFSTDKVSSTDRRIIAGKAGKRPYHIVYQAFAKTKRGVSDKPLESASSGKITRDTPKSDIKEMDKDTLKALFMRIADGEGKGYDASEGHRIVKSRGYAIKRTFYYFDFKKKDEQKRMELFGRTAIG